MVLLILLLPEVSLLTVLSSFCFLRRWWRWPRRWELLCRLGRAWSGSSLLKSPDPSRKLLCQGNPALSSLWAPTRPWVKPCPLLQDMGKPCSSPQVRLFCCSFKCRCGREENKSLFPLEELQHLCGKGLTRSHSTAVRAIFGDNFPRFLSSGRCSV